MQTHFTMIWGVRHEVFSKRGTSTQYGLVKLTDSYESSSGAADSGVGASSYALNTAYNQLKQKMLASNPTYGLIIARVTANIVLVTCDLTPLSILLSQLSSALGTLQASEQTVCVSITTITSDTSKARPGILVFPTANSFSSSGCAVYYQSAIDTITYVSYSNARAYRISGCFMLYTNSV